MEDRGHPYPVHGAEVDCLSKVEALIEAAVVSSGKRDDELSSTLVCSVNLKDMRQTRTFLLIAVDHRQEAYVNKLEYSLGLRRPSECWGS